MNNAMTMIPVGIEEVMPVLVEVCENKGAYKHCGIAPPHLVINLEAGNGQTTVTRFVTKTLSDHGVRRFGGLDAYLEYTLDGSMTQMKQVFADIRACAVYTNSFEGVVAMDVAALGQYAKEAQAEYFLEEIRKVCHTATVILYIGSTPSRGVVSLVDKLKDTVGNMACIHLDGYTQDELAQIALVQLDAFGVAVEDSEEFRSALKDIIQQEACRTAKDTLVVAEKAVKAADFTPFVPVLTTERLKAAFADVFNDKKEEAK